MLSGLSNIDFSVIVARVIVLLVAFTIHELAHAITADFLGDPTPRQQGRFTLNPLKHLDPIGTLMLIVTGFGWAKPVMIQPWNLRGNPRTSMAIVAAAGPLSNIVLAIIFSIPLNIGLVEVTQNGTFLPSFGFLLLQFVWINLILAFFNLIPIPPLDGYKILSALLPADVVQRIRPIENYGFLLLMLAVFFLPRAGIDIIGMLVVEPARFVMSAMLGM